MSESASRIDHEENDGGGVFYLFDHETRAARLTYSVVSDDELTLDYVEVYPAYRRRGFARELVDHIAKFARRRQVLITPICGVAGGILRSDPRYDDVLR